MIDSGRIELGVAIIIGGGCYGTFYATQLLEARRRGKLGLAEMVVVDRDRSCRAASELPGEGWRLAQADWSEYLDSPEFDSLCRCSGPPGYLVPSPLMPNLLFGWLVRRALEAGSASAVAEPLEPAFETPFETVAPDQTRYLSYADWLCPTHCVEPLTCPVTKAPRTWDLADTMQERVNHDPSLTGPVVFSCRHLAYGVGAIPLSALAEARGTVSRAASGRDTTRLLVATSSACHGAVALLRIEPAVAELRRS